MNRSVIRACVLWAALSGLTACGGGGGGDASGGGDPGGTATLSGLVPAAPALGAVLFAQAEILRPALEGAVWRYRGQTQASATAPLLDFTETVTHSAVSAGGMTETSVDTAQGGSTDSTAVSRSGGTISQSVTLDATGRGQPGAVTLIELRSPVRAGDQIVMIDRRYTDTTIDVDGDRITDALDFAMLAQVVGLETVTLANRPALQALRVDLSIRVRVVPSGTRVPGPVVESRFQTWYAPGLGIVRQASQTPGSAATETRDQWLQSWDAGSTGFGALPALALVVPAGNGVFPGRDVPGAGMQAYTLADRVLLVTRLSETFRDSLVSRVDLRGRVVEAQLLPGLAINSSTTSAGHAMGVNFLEPLSSGSSTTYGLTRIDSDGRLVGAARGITLDLGGGLGLAATDNVRMAIDGNTMWLLFNRSYRTLPAPFTSHLVLRACDLNGVPLAPDQIVEAPSGADLQLAASEGQAFFTWRRFDTGNSIMMGRASLGGATDVRVLATPLPGVNSFLTPLRLAGRNAAIWPVQLGTGQTLGAAGGMLFDEGLQAIRAGATLLDEQVGGFPPFSSESPGAVARAGRIVVSGTVTGTLWPSDTSTQNIDVVSWMDTGAQALARTTTSMVRLPSMRAQRQAVYADRVILFGSGTPAQSAVVWLRN